jgi:hypothetical protein
MPQFKQKTSTSESTQPPQSPPSVSDPRPELSASPSPSSTPATESAPKPKVLDTIFKFHMLDGEYPLRQVGTIAELEAILKHVSTEGLTLHNQKGFEWFPVTSIRKVKVELQ